MFNLEAGPFEQNIYENLNDRRNGEYSCFNLLLFTSKMNWQEA